MNSQFEVAVVCHDAGGAEIVSSWLTQFTGTYCLVLDGPAIGVFKRKFDNIEIYSFFEAVNNCQWVLTSASWQSSLERVAISHAKNMGKKVVTFLDHWVNYKERLTENGQLYSPDEIWVGDSEAEVVAKLEFPDIPVILKSNPYYQDIQKQLEKKPVRNFNNENIAVLYVCEPIKEHAFLQHGDERFWGYTEEDAVNYFFMNVETVNPNIQVVNIRPHPSENIDKYNWVKEKFDSHIEINTGLTLVDEIAAADIVIGCDSMAMVVGLLANKRVISVIPPGGRPCCLPHAQIEHLQELLKI
jgi:hypothetical protein